MEQIAYRLESAGEMTVTSAMLPALASIGLRVITIPTSPMLIVELVLSGVVTSPTSLVAGVLVSMKTPPQLSAIPPPSQTIAFATPPTIMTVKPVEGSPLGITCSSGVIKAEKEFMAKMVDNF